MTNKSCFFQKFWNQTFGSFGCFDFKTDFCFYFTWHHHGSIGGWRLKGHHNLRLLPSFEGLITCFCDSSFQPSRLVFEWVLWRSSFQLSSSTKDSCFCSWRWGWTHNSSRLTWNPLSGSWSEKPLPPHCLQGIPCSLSASEKRQMKKNPWTSAQIVEAFVRKERGTLWLIAPHEQDLKEGLTSTNEDHRGPLETRKSLFKPQTRPSSRYQALTDPASGGDDQNKQWLQQRPDKRRNVLDVRRPHQPADYTVTVIFRYSKLHIQRKRKTFVLHSCGTESLTATGKEFNQKESNRSLF